MTKYKTGYSRAIEAVEVIRETEQSVVVLSSWGSKKERMERKVNDYHRYHDTWGAAHAFLLERARNKVAYAQDELERAARALAEIEAMKEPDSVTERKS